jgi:hypothetical protein
MKKIPWVVFAWIGSLSVAPITWWLVGDVSQLTGFRRTWTPPAWLIENTHLLGVAGVLAMVSAAAILVVGLRMRFFARPLLTAFVPLICSAALAAFNYRVMTRMTVDTNVGGGVAMLLGMPVALCLAVLHLYLLRDELRREHYDYPEFRPRLRRPAHG